MAEHHASHEPLAETGKRRRDVQDNNKDNDSEFITVKLPLGQIARPTTTDGLQELLVNTQTAHEAMRREAYGAVAILHFMARRARRPGLASTVADPHASTGR